MNPKRQGVLSHKLVVLANLMLENIDELQATTPIVKKAKEDLIVFCEELNNSIAGTPAMTSQTYFQDLSKKIDTIMRKNFDSNM